MVSFPRCAKAVLQEKVDQIGIRRGCFFILFLPFFPPLPSVVHDGGVVVRRLQVVALPHLEVPLVNWQPGVKEHRKQEEKSK